MEIILIRHGESVANTESKFQGLTYDTPLTKLGKQQAHELSKQIGRNFTNIDKFYCSPLQRTAETAEILCKNLLMGEPEPRPELVEISHGPWENLTVEEVKSQFKDSYWQYKNEPDKFQLDGADDIQAVQDRAIDFIETIIESENYSRIVCVTHDMVIRTVLLKALRRSLKDLWMFDLTNCGYSVLEWGKLPQVIVLNETSHLEELPGSDTPQAI